MLDVWRVKKTKQIVYPIGAVADNSRYVLCLFPYKEKSKKGLLGVVQPVKTENLMKDREAI